MIAEVQKWPSRETLEDLKECLDYCSTSWLGLYCRLGGAHLLLEVYPIYTMCHMCYMVYTYIYHTLSCCGVLC